MFLVFHVLFQFKKTFYSLLFAVWQLADFVVLRHFSLRAYCLLVLTVPTHLRSRTLEFSSFFYFSPRIIRVDTYMIVYEHIFCTDSKCLLMVLIFLLISLKYSEENFKNTNGIQTQKNKKKGKTPKGNGESSKKWVGLYLIHVRRKRLLLFLIVKYTTLK